MNDSNFPRVGTVRISDYTCPAEQKAPDGNFRKRATRFFLNGKWSEWCKDDHDLFKPYYLNGGRWEPFRLPEGAEFTETPLKFDNFDQGSRMLKAIRDDLNNRKVTLFAGPDWKLPWHSPWNRAGNGDAEWTRLALCHCEDWDPKTGKAQSEAVGNENPRPVYLLHLHFAPGSGVTDHPCATSPVTRVITNP